MELNAPTFLFIKIIFFLTFWGVWGKLEYVNVNKDKHKSIILSRKMCTKEQIFRFTSKSKSYVSFPQADRLTFTKYADKI